MTKTPPKSKLTQKIDAVLDKAGRLEAMQKAMENLRGATFSEADEYEKQMLEEYQRLCEARGVEP